MGRSSQRHGSSGQTAPDRAEQTVLVQIERCRHRLAVLSLLRRLVVLLAVAATALLLVVAADHGWPEGLPPTWLRRVMLAWAAVLAAGALWLVGVSIRRRLNPLLAARLLERWSGIPHNLLVNALLLRRSPAGAYAYSAATHQAAAAVSAHAPARLSEPGAFRLPGAIALAVVGVWILYVAVSPKPIWPSIARFFGATVAAPTASRLEMLRPRPAEIIHAGEPLELEFAVHGRPVERVELGLLDPRGGSADPLATYTLRKIDARGPQRWILRLAPHEVTGDIHFRCVAGDAVLTGVIPVHPLPLLLGMEVDLEPPAYTGWPSLTVSGPDLDVLAGTRATYRAWANVPVREAVFVLSNDRQTRRRMTVDPGDPRLLTVSMLLVEGGQYRIEFSDQWGYPAPDPAAYCIVVRPDAPPTARIVLPAEGDAPQDVVDVTRHPRLAAVAEDDVALAEVLLAYDRDGVSNRRTVARPTDADQRRLRVEVDVADLPLEPGRQLRVWFEARDGRVLPDGRPAPQIGRSREITLIRPAAPIRPVPVSPEPKELASPENAAASPPANGQPGQGTQSGDGARQTATTQQTAADGSDAGSTPAADEFDEELRRFLAEHGHMAREAGQQMRDASERSADAMQEEAAEPQPADAEQRDPQEAPASAPIKPQGAHPEGDTQCDSPGEAGTESQPESAGQTADDGDLGDAPPEAGSTPDPGEGVAPPSSTEPAAGGGGAPDQSGSASDSPEPPLEDAASEASDGGPLDSVGLVETIDLLGMLERGESLSEDMLTDLGWSAPQAVAFIKALDRLHTAAREAGRLADVQKLRVDLRAGDAEVRVGAGLTPALAGPLDGLQLPEDKLTQLAAPPEQDVPAHLRKLLDAYYRALAQRRAQDRP